MYNLDLDGKTKKYIEFKLHKKYARNNPALKIVFKDNINYNLKVLKKIKKLLENGVTFNTDKINFVLENYNDDIINAFKTFGIDNIEKKYSFVYDVVCDYLDNLWVKTNPCKFCDNKCIATRNNHLYLKEDGCCYSFEWTKNIFKPIKNKKRCKYLGQNKRCQVKNISCLLFTCEYLTKSGTFNINYNDLLLLRLFFNRKQKLILRYNYFQKKDAIISKLLKEDNTPYIVYLLKYKFTI